MLLKRSLTALIAIPSVSALIYWGSETTFLILVLLAAGFSLSEFFTMCLSFQRPLLQYGFVTLGLLTLLAINSYQHHLIVHYPFHTSSLVSVTFALVTVTVMLVFIIQLVQFPQRVIFGKTVLLLPAGIVYVCFFLSYLMLIKNNDSGTQWVFFILFVLWLGDSGAYLVGSTLGRNKLAPVVSPNKTIEGACGGVLTTVATGFACRLLFLEELPVVDCFVLTIALSFMGQVGDLCESALKRAHAIKDSGNLLPGHGGVLDRIDSLLFAAPVVFYYKILLL